jgi:hypothetical protein
MQEKDFKKYQNSFNKYSFKECLIEKYENSNNPNPLYYEKTINNWFEQRCSDLINDDRLKDSHIVLKNYLLDLKFIMIGTIELYEAVERYNNIIVRLNRVNIKAYNLKTQIQYLDYFNLIIRENIIKGLDTKAKNIKDFILLRFDEVKLILRDNFHIDILKSPLKKQIKKTINILENSINHTETFNTKGTNSDSLVELNNVEKINKHYSIFEEGAFDEFLKWIIKSNDEPKKKISFIYQKLKEEDKIRTTNFKKFSEWAYNNDYLDEDTYSELLIDGSFLSPSKILTKGRRELYNQIIQN